MAAIHRRDSLSSQDRRAAGHGLKTIIEESETESVLPPPPATTTTTLNGSRSTIERWLSPTSDHHHFFPTPRGFHFMAVPIPPSSPSSDESHNESSPWPGHDEDDEDDGGSDVGTDSTEFEDLCDVPDGGAQETRRRSSQPRPAVIPAGDRAGADHRTAGRDSSSKGAWILSRPTARMSGTAVQLSPEAIEILERQQAVAVPAVSSPPSLDGSLGSEEQMAGLSPPATPVIGPGDSAAGEVGGERGPARPWSGVHLEPAALETLRSLSRVGDGGDDYADNLSVIEAFAGCERGQPQMVETGRPSLRLFTRLNPNQSPLLLPPLPPPLPSTCCEPEPAQLDIPSPNTFFAGLAPGSRTTWGPAAPDSASVNSGTAERFYRTVWDELDLDILPHPAGPDDAAVHGEPPSSQQCPPFTSALPVEHVAIDVPPPRLPLQQPTPLSLAVEQISSSSLAIGETAVAAEMVDRGHNHDQTRERQQLAISHLERMQRWLAAQRAAAQFLTAAASAGCDVDEQQQQQQEQQQQPEQQPTVGRKKSVRFLQPALESDRFPLPPVRGRESESAYYRAFLAQLGRQHPRDVFVHRQPRFEALQAQRVSLRDEHRDQLLGKYQLRVEPQSMKRRLSANVARGDDEPAEDDPDRLRREREREALDQMSMSMWHVAAMRLLVGGGRLVRAPVERRLRTHRAARILDLGGQPACDWAWHCAAQYPGATVWTVTTRSARRMANCNVRGPPNHRQVAVPRLTRLPFPDATFDLVSARELHACLVRARGEGGEDEWDGCLRECLRVLRPGGCLDFSLLDSAMVEPGPLGLARSVEFGLALRTLGYDPAPTRSWLGRLDRAGFRHVRRAWVRLPVGGGGGEKNDTDGAAAVCGLAAGWAWERWMLRCELERVAGELRLADMATTGEAAQKAGRCLAGVHAVVEEGRACGAAWRMLTGWARKPGK